MEKFTLDMYLLDSDRNANVLPNNPDEWKGSHSGKIHEINIWKLHTQIAVKWLSYLGNLCYK